MLFPEKWDLADPLPPGLTPADLQDLIDRAIPWNGADQDPAGLDDWPEPQPLTSKIDPEPYPLDALPESIQAAVEEVQTFVQAPMPMVACSALAAVSLAIQAHWDIKRAERLFGPVGLFLMIVADSGERKSSSDSPFFKPIRDYELQQAMDAKPLLEEYRAAQDAWEAKRNGIKDAIRQASKNGEDTKDQEAKLRDLDHEQPQRPRVPRLIYTDTTPESLKFDLAKKWPSAGLVSSEAGLVLGSHGMSNESQMRNLATLNQLWDGTPIHTDRRTSESFIVQGARLTMALQVQEATLRAFLDQSGDLARGSGWLARFLVTRPESTQGHRPFSEAPESWPNLTIFCRRITTILNQTVPMDESGALQPGMLEFSPGAKSEWIAFHDRVERELVNGGRFYDIRDVASKIADNAARLSALFHVFDGAIGSSIGSGSFTRAARIAEWHLTEARRFFGELALPTGLANAGRLESWLIDRCKRTGGNQVPTKEVQQYGPNGLREKAVIDAAMQELEELGRARHHHEGRRKFLVLNPALLLQQTPATAIPAIPATHAEPGEPQDDMIGSRNSDNSGSNPEDLVHLVHLPAVSGESFSEDL